MTKRGDAVLAKLHQARDDLAVVRALLGAEHPAYAQLGEVMRILHAVEGLISPL